MRRFPIKAAFNRNYRGVRKGVFFMQKIKGVKNMGCNCAKYDEDLGRYQCSVSGSECMYLIPDSKACAKDYGEWPDSED